MSFRNQLITAAGVLIAKAIRSPGAQTAAQYPPYGTGWILDGPSGQIYARFLNAATARINTLTDFFDSTQSVGIPDLFKLVGFSNTNYASGTYLYNPHTNFYLATSQSIPDSVHTPIVHDTQPEGGQMNGVDLITHNASGSFRIRRDGVYQINAGLRWTSNDTGQCYIGIKKGSTSSFSSSSFLATMPGSIDTVSASNDGVSVSICRYLTKDTYIWITGYQNTGAALSVTGTSEQSTFVDITYVAAPDAQLYSPNG